MLQLHCSKCGFSVSTHIILKAWAQAPGRMYRHSERKKNVRNLGRTSKTTRKVSALNLERELRAAPVTAVLVVLDLVVRLHTEPVRDRAACDVSNVRSNSSMTCRRLKHTGSGERPWRA